jgi:exodeoxyribonuclease VII large subunit
MPESFFDFRARIAAPKAESQTDAARLARAMSVADLTAQIDAAIRGGVPASVLVKGEISNLNIHRASGHIYFTLKDARSCIDCVMFKSDADRLKTKPRDGDEVLAGGGVRVYLQRGRYQLYVNSLSPIGTGALEARFRALKEKLETEGLFDAEGKRPLPLYPRRVAVVTSREAAALQDMLKVFGRFPFLKITLVHVPVQGPGASVKIAAALTAISKRADAFDLIVLGRGGGSLEDLWEFNEEVVARAIVASALPVITGIGHEVDVSIADLVADYHAHTPTEAAQVITARWRQAAELIDASSGRLGRALARIVLAARQRLTGIERHELFRRPTDRVDRLREQLDDRERQLRQRLSSVAQRAHRRLAQAEARLHGQHPRARLSLARERIDGLLRLYRQQQRSSVANAGRQIDALSRQLEALAPTRVLERGYTITTLKNGKIVRRAADVRGGDTLVTHFQDGTVESTAKDPKQPELF